MQDIRLGNPTMEVVSEKSMVVQLPSGASTGIYEALELRKE